MSDVATRPACRRCDGAGALPIDHLPGFRPERCHRCLGDGLEPAWAVSRAAWAVEFRRLTDALCGLTLQDLEVAWAMPGTPDDVAAHADACGATSPQALDATRAAMPRSTKTSQAQPASASLSPTLD